MGLFDKLAGSKNVTLNPKSALVLSAVTMIASDGVIDETELGDLIKIVRGDRDSVQTAMKVLKANPLSECMNLIAGCLNEKQKIAAIAILADLAMADGVLAGEEQKVLQMYVEKFGINEETLKPIIDVVALKNDFSVFL